jgi:hypothetical protein
VCEAEVCVQVLRNENQLRNADVELQQRAVEYLTLTSIANTDMLVGGLLSSNVTWIKLLFGSHCLICSI